MDQSFLKRKMRYLIQCAQRAALYYPVCTARCAILSSVHSALRYIIQCAQRIALYYPAFFSRSALYYPEYDYSHRL